MPWLFYRSDASGWRWAHLGDDGGPKAESALHFDTRLECVADAKLRGFGQDSASDWEPPQGTPSLA